jgi:hypothetical protein
MFSEFIFLALGLILGACGMKVVVDYKDKHVRREKALTERYRASSEQLRVSLAQATATPGWAVATPRIDTDEAPLPLDLFTQDDQEALNQGVRVVKTRMGGAR